MCLNYHLWWQLEYYVRCIRNALGGKATELGKDGIYKGITEGKLRRGEDKPGKKDKNKEKQSGNCFNGFRCFYVTPTH